MTDKNTLEETREQILHILELINSSEYSSEGKMALDNLRKAIAIERPMFSLKNLVFEYFTDLLGDISKSEIFGDDIGMLRDELTGKHPYSRIYALKQNFVNLLEERDKKIVSILEEMIHTFELYVESDYKKKELLDNVRYNELEYELYMFCQNEIQVQTVSTLLLFHISCIVLNLPKDSEAYFRPQEIFSSIYPNPNEDILDTLILHLDYVKLMMKKLMGQEILYVDTYFAGGVIILNLR